MKKKITCDEEKKITSDEEKLTFLTKFIFDDKIHIIYWRSFNFHWLIVALLALKQT